MWATCVNNQNVKTALHDMKKINKKSKFPPQLQLNKDIYPTHSYLFSSVKTAVTYLPLMFLIKKSKLQELCFPLLVQ